MQRLATLVELKKLYRNCLRADTLLELQTPIYASLPPRECAGLGRGWGVGAGPAPFLRRGVDCGSARRNTRHASHCTRHTSHRHAAAADARRDGADGAAAEEQERLQAAVELIAEMQLTSDQLRFGLRTLLPGFGVEFEGEGAPEAREASVREAARDFAQRLRERAAAELPLLPFERCVWAAVGLGG